MGSLCAGQTDISELDRGGGSYLAYLVRLFPAIAGTSGVWCFLGNSCWLKAGSARASFECWDGVQGCFPTNRHAGAIWVAC